MDDDLLPVKRALISVSDKEGLIELTKSLVDRGVEIISTGGTANYLSKEGIRVTEIFDITKFPELLDGRLKTLHPKVFGGILARRELNEDHEQLAEFNIPEFDLVIVDLYPFEETVKSGALEADVIEVEDFGNYKLITASFDSLKIKAKVKRELDIPSEKVILKLPAEHCCIYENNKLI